VKSHAVKHEAAKNTKDVLLRALRAFVFNRRPTLISTLANSLDLSQGRNIRKRGILRFRDLGILGQTLTPRGRAGEREFQETPSGFPRFCAKAPRGFPAHGARARGAWSIVAASMVSPALSDSGLPAPCSTDRRSMVGHQPASQAGGRWREKCTAGSDPLLPAIGQSTRPRDRSRHGGFESRPVQFPILPQKSTQSAKDPFAFSAFFRGQRYGPQRKEADVLNSSENMFCPVWAAVRLPSRHAGPPQLERKNL
jgi:hypothetical protein